MPLDPTAPIDADDQLPPVEPPSAGFIVQLFVIPGVIVVAIVSVWLMFSWIVHRGSARPEDVVQGLAEAGPARWQKASELADMLRSSRHAEFRRNENAATQLAGILERELELTAAGGAMEADAVNLRYFLCRALGEFEVQPGVDVLLRAATTARDQRERRVQRGAIQALAILAYNQLHSQPPQTLDSRVEATLLRLAEDDDPLIRSETAYALGRIASRASLEQLEVMIDDPHADTRYNAAVGLAHQGRAEAIETLAEMLDLRIDVSVREEPNPQLQVVKRAVIMKNAMAAAVELARQNPAADMTAITDALDRIETATPAQLQEAGVDPLVAAEAKRTLEFLSEERATEPQSIRA